MKKAHQDLGIDVKQTEPEDAKRKARAERFIFYYYLFPGKVASPYVLKFVFLTSGLAQINWTVQKPKLASCNLCHAFG
jgi:hypothetical protein